jgi:outer membrane protein TolC
VRELYSACFQDALITALNHRPEIEECRQEIKKACVNIDVAKNELRPQLNLILMTYVSGLEGDVHMGQAWSDQFNLGRPTYSTGVVFEYPLGNRAAQAKMHKREGEFCQLTSKLADTTANVRMEVETTIRDINNNYREMLCQAHAVVGNLCEVEYLTARWEASLDEQRSSSVLLDDLLNAYDRLCRSEGLYAAKLVAYNAGFPTLDHATGTLVDCELLRQMNTVRPVGRATASTPSPTAGVNSVQPAPPPRAAENSGVPPRR